MELSKEQKQTRFLAIVLPALTLSTHVLLSLSFALPADDQARAFVSLVYNGLAALASVLGLFGAVRLVPSLVSAYTIVQTCTLSFVTLGLVNIMLPLDLRILNPAVSSLQFDETAMCRDIDSGFGWDEEWLVKCSESLKMVQICVALAGLILMVAQWWALVTVRTWSRELQVQRRRESEAADVEKLPPMAGGNDDLLCEKSGF
jgi:hypothetical protein